MTLRRMRSPARRTRLAPPGAVFSDTAGFTPPASLGSLLRRAHMLLVFGAVAVVGLALAIPALVTLHITAAHDLELVGRAVSHTVEAAMVFRDGDAAQEALRAIVANEDVADATVAAPDGKLLAQWHEDRSGWIASLSAAASRLLRERPALVPVLHDGTVIGQVFVRCGGRSVLGFLTFAALGILFCQVLSAAGALYLSGRIVGRIAGPLHALADVAGTVQRERAFGQRVPGAEIAELNDLGNSFNALLAELDAWQALLEGENQRLSHQASHDGLTGLANRAFFEGRLNRALSDAEQGGPGLAVILIDCDKFKDINDGFGHAAGDAVLVSTAARLRGQVREHDLVARLGGDEFAILIVPHDDAADLHGLVHAIVLAMRLPIAVPGDLHIVASLSIGFATSQQDGTNPAVLLQRADEAMYRAKRARGGSAARAETITTGEAL